MGRMQLPLLLPKQTGLPRWMPKPHPMLGEAQSSIAFCPYICTCIPTPGSLTPVSWTAFWQ